MKRISLRKLLRMIQRKRHSHGFGLHSPFAYRLVTDVIYGNHHFNAFYDIDSFLNSHGIEAKQYSSSGRVAFRLINHFKPAHILEINSANGAATPFLLASDSNIRCTCIDNLPDNLAQAQTLLRDYDNNRIRFCSGFEVGAAGKYDAICIHLSGNANPVSVDWLMGMSHEGTFWFVDGIDNRAAKQFWFSIVKDERIWTSFDMDNAGIAFLQPTYSKTNYLI